MPHQPFHPQTPRSSSTSQVFWNDWQALSLGRAVTERKRAEESAQRSEALLRAVLDNSPAATFVKDLQGRFVLVNKRFAELTGRAAEDLIGQAGYPLSRSVEETMMLEADQAVMTGAVPIEREEVFSSSEGQRTFLAVRFPLFGPSGALTGICGILNDVTDRTVRTVGESVPVFPRTVRSACESRGFRAGAIHAASRAQRLFPARGGDTL